DRAKPAVPFGGKYRIIDFVLSNFINSELYAIHVLVQFKSQSLIEHLQAGGRFWGAPAGSIFYFHRPGADAYRAELVSGYGRRGLSKHPPHQAVQTGYRSGLWGRPYLPHGHPSDGGVSPRTRRRGDHLGLPGCGARGLSVWHSANG